MFSMFIIANKHRIRRRRSAVVFYESNGGMSGDSTRVRYKIPLVSGQCLIPGLPFLDATCLFIIQDSTRIYS